MTLHWADIVAEGTNRFGELTIGIDPILGDIPFVFHKSTSNPIDVLDHYVTFLISAITGHVGFVKFQSAFFEAFGSRGLVSLAKGIALAKRAGLGVVLDAKRGDIGSTAEAYAKAYLTPKETHASDLEVDCMTINPFLGPDSLEPFVRCAHQFGKGLFILVKTSNPGAKWIQDVAVYDFCISDQIAKLVNTWGDESRGTTGLSAIGAVVGATFPEDGLRLRTIMPNAIFLAPGIGPQGGRPEDIKAIRRRDNTGVLVPVSRGITKVDDLKIGKDNYAVLIQERIQALRASLA